MSSIRRFLDRLYDGCPDGFLDVRSCPSGRRAWASIGDWYTLGPFLTREVRAGQDAYFGIATRRDTTSGTAANLALLPAVWIDHDRPPTEAAALLADFPFKPSIVVQSGLGVHEYWKLREPLDLRERGALHRAASVLRRLAAYLGGDDRATDPTRVLRLPDSFNFKYDRPLPVALAAETDATINLAELEDFLPAEVARRNELVIEKSIAFADKGDPVAIRKGRRNDVLYLTIRGLRARGLSYAAISDAVRVLNDKHTDEPLPDAELRKLLHTALAQPDRPDFAVRQAAGVVLRGAWGNA